MIQWTKKPKTKFFNRLIKLVKILASFTSLAMAWSSQLWINFVMLKRAFSLFHCKRNMQWASITVHPTLDTLQQVRMPNFELPRVQKIEIQEKSQNYFILKKVKKQTMACKITAEEVLFEWSHQSISLTDSKS